MRTEFGLCAYFLIEVLNCVCVCVCSIELRPSILFHRMKAMQRKYRLLGRNCIYFHQHVLVYAKIHTGEKWKGRGRDASDCEDNLDVLCVQISCRNHLSSVHLSVMLCQLPRRIGTLLPIVRRTATQHNQAIMSIIITEVV